MTLAMRYTLKDFTDITFNGFDIKLPEETLVIITELSQQVGSPTYVKTPPFHKRENVLKMGGSDSVGGGEFKRKKKASQRSCYSLIFITHFYRVHCSYQVGFDLSLPSNLGFQKIREV